MNFNSDKGFKSNSGFGNGFGTDTTKSFGSTGGFSKPQDSGGFGNGFKGGQPAGLFNKDELNKPAFGGFFNGTQDRIGVADDLGRMHVERMLMVPAGSFYNQHYRPLTAHATPQKIDYFVEATQGGTVLNSGAIAKANFDFLSPRSQASSEIAQIANGWDTARFMFIMKINATLAGEAEMTYLLFGYTSHTGITMSGAVDPNMDLYFTRCISMRNLDTKNAFGVRNSTPMVAAANNILFRDRYSRESLHTLRPEDVVGNAALPKVIDDFNEVESYDSRTVLGRTPKLSNMAWSNPNMYLSRSLSHYSTVVKNSFSGVGSMADNQYESLLNGIQDESPVHCVPLRWLKNNTSWSDTVSVSWKEMSEAFPEIERDDVTTSEVVNPAKLASMDARNNSERTDGSTYEQIMVSRLAQELPALLMTNMFVRIRFTATNAEVDEFGRPIVLVEAYEHMVGGDLVVGCIDALKASFLDTIFVSMTKGGMVDVSLKIDFSIYGSGDINISYNRGPETPFSVPVFAESNFSAMITNDSHSISNMSASLAKLMEVVESGATESTNGTKFGSVPAFSF